eukprot:RCo016320
MPAPRALLALGVVLLVVLLTVVRLTLSLSSHRGPPPEPFPSHDPEPELHSSSSSGFWPNFRGCRSGSAELSGARAAPQSLPAAMAHDQSYMKGYDLTRIPEQIQAQLYREVSQAPHSHPFAMPQKGRLFKAVWTGGPHSGEWDILGSPPGCTPVKKVSLEEVKAALDGKWVHIQGDSTSRQLFNSLVTVLAPQANYRAVRKNDLCYLAFAATRRALLREAPALNHTALEENHLRMCACRRGMLFWDTRKGPTPYFTKANDGFDLRVTYSYKELMFEPTDAAALDGNYPEIVRDVATGNNLYEAFQKDLPDIWVGNAGAHAFHLRLGMGLSAPDDQTLADFGRNLTRYVELFQRRFLAQQQPKKPPRCLLWKANNVPPPQLCPPQHFLWLNQVTIPAMLMAGVHVIDPEDLSRYNRQRPVSCDIHLTGVPQQNVAWLALTAVVRGCLGSPAVTTEAKPP